MESDNIAALGVQEGRARKEGKSSSATHISVCSAQDEGGRFGNQLHLSKTIPWATTIDEGVGVEHFITWDCVQPVLLLIRLLLVRVAIGEC